VTDLGLLAIFVTVGGISYESHACGSHAKANTRPGVAMHADVCDTAFPNPCRDESAAPPEHSDIIVGAPAALKYPRQSSADHRSFWNCATRQANHIVLRPYRRRMQPIQASPGFFRTQLQDCYVWSVHQLVSVEQHYAGLLGQRCLKMVRHRIQSKAVGINREAVCMQRLSYRRRGFYPKARRYLCYHRQR
jgi:hypothetical protein